MYIVPTMTRSSTDTDPKFKTCFGEAATYAHYYNVMGSISVEDFKRHHDITDITEHIGDLQIRHGTDMYNEIIHMNMIDECTIHRLVELNDRHGNAIRLKIVDSLCECSPNSIKYIYYGLLAVRHMLDLKLSNVDFVEVGGGYGGQCVILNELFKMFGIQINKYVSIDLDNVVKFQERYVALCGPYDKCEFISYEQYKSYSFSKDSYLLSSYCLSELGDETRKDYYDNLLQYTPHGLVIWNNPYCVDLPKNYTEISHSCREVVGKFLKF